MPPSTAVGAAEGTRRRGVPDPLLPGAGVGVDSDRRRSIRGSRRVPLPRGRRRRRRRSGLPRDVPRRGELAGAGERDRGGIRASGEVRDRRRRPGRAGDVGGENRQGEARALRRVHRQGGASPRAHRHRRRRSLRRHAPRALAPRPVRAAPLPRVRDGGVARLAPRVRRETGAVPVRLARGVLRVWRGGDDPHGRRGVRRTVALWAPRVARGGGVGERRHRRALHRVCDELDELDRGWRRGAGGGDGDAQARGGEASGWVRQRGARQRGARPRQGRRAASRESGRAVQHVLHRAGGLVELLTCN
mmetsp:Transcript_5662/g.23268  ORF Transcript_5662/g.23268 Transcript_5662/m.23268 type:complete len:304 (-) Transcript_5662:29-940(-)